MARLWSCGFELQSTTIELESLSGSPAIDTTIKHGGLASARFNPTAGTSYFRHRFSNAGETNVWVRGYIYIASAPSSGDTEVLLMRSTGAGDLASLRLKSDRTIILYDNLNTTQRGSASSAIPLNEWHYIELDVSGGTGNIYARLDGVDFANGGGGSPTDQGYIVIGPHTTTTCDIYMDDIAINSDSGSVQNSWPGAGYIVHLQPNAAGDNNGWSGPYTNVDEITPDDSSTENFSHASATDDFNMTDTPAHLNSGSTINVVSVGVRFSVDVGGGTIGTTVVRLKSQASGTTLEGSSISNSLNAYSTNQTGVPYIYTLTSYVDTQAGGAWTKALLDSSQIGYRLTNSPTNTPRYSTLWALIDYVPGAATTYTQNNSATANTKTTYYCGYGYDWKIGGQNRGFNS